jgi:UDP-N-acetylmuramate dehydrogenase
LKIEKNVVLAPFTSFQVGGEADAFCRVQTKEDLQKAFEEADAKNMPVFFLGGGSNILFSDTGFRGMVIKMENREIKQREDERFVVGNGIMNAELSTFAKKNGYDYSPFVTIPGSIGGAVCGNAGIPEHEIGDHVVSAEVFDVEGKAFRKVPKDFFEFSYRHTVFHKKPDLRTKLIVWSVELNLPKGSEQEIDQKAKQGFAWRREKQPWGKNGGSFFKNPSEGAAGYFLERAGMKGERIGDAFFSEKHANFMMNAGSATQAEILELARLGAKKVQEKFGVILVPEVRILDEWGEEVEF